MDNNSYRKHPRMDAPPNTGSGRRNGYMLVSFEIVDEVSIVRLDDGKANVLSLPMLRALNSVLDQAENAKLPIILTGRAKFFSAGFDLGTMAKGGQETFDMLNGGISLAVRLLRIQTPLILACNGHAMAMGMFLLQCGDYRIGVSGNFKYVANEVTMGMAVPWSMIEVLRQRLTPAAFSRAVLLAETFTPVNGIENGVLDRVVTNEEELMPAAMEFAKSTFNLNFDAHAISKRRLRDEVVDAIQTGWEKDKNDMRALLQIP